MAIFLKPKISPSVCVMIIVFGILKLFIEGSVAVSVDDFMIEKYIRLFNSSFWV